MSYRERDIMHENGAFWVLRDAKAGAYVVFRAGATHSVSDSAYTLDRAGFTLAQARCDYLARSRSDNPRRYA